MEGFTDLPRDATVHQQMRVPPVARPRDNLEVGECPPCNVDDLQRLFHVLQRYHQQAGVFGSCGAQQVGP